MKTLRFDLGERLHYLGMVVTVVGWSGDYIAVTTPGGSVITIRWDHLAQAAEQVAA